MKKEGGVNERKEEGEEENDEEETKRKMKKYRETKCEEGPEGKTRF